MGTGGSYNPPSTGGGEISTTYAALMALQAANELTPGQQYSFPFKTIHWLVDANGNYCNDLVDAPAPGNITITPDAVGSNPVTYFYRVIALNEVPSRSLPSIEIEVVQGDSTTELIIDCDIPSWATQLAVFRGTQTNVYTEANNSTINSTPFDLFADFVASDYSSFLEIPVQQVVDEGLTPTRSIIEGAEETLVVTATSTNTLAKVAFSVDYPQDYIEYVIDFNALSLMPIPQLYDISEETYIDDYRGTITRRRDTLGNDLGWDTNSVKYRRWSITQPAWDSETTYSTEPPNNICQNNGIIYGAKVESTDVEPGVDEGWETYWDVIINTAIMGEYHGNNSTVVEINSYMIGIQDETDFEDVLALGEGSINNVQLTGFNIFPFIVLPENSRNNVFNPNVEYPIFWEAVGDGETITHYETANGVRQTYIDDSENSIVIGEGKVGVDVLN